MHPRMKRSTASRGAVAILVALPLLPVCGFVLDVVGLKLGFALFAAAWSLLTMAHAVATGWPGFAGVRGLLGMVEGAAQPAGMKVVAEWFPERERALASGIFNSGSSSSRYPGFRRSWPGLSCIPAGAPLSCWWG